MNKIDLKILALRKAVWGVREICVFLDCSKTKAYHEIAWCRLRASLDTKEKSVPRDQFLDYKGTNYEAEMKNAYIEKEAMENARGITEIRVADLHK